MDSKTTLQTQVFPPVVEDAFRHLNRVMAGGIREIAFASLNKGQVEPEVAKEASERMVRRATNAYKKVLEDCQGTQDTAKTLARLMAELTVSSTAIWVVAQHTAINYMDQENKRGDEK